MFAVPRIFFLNSAYFDFINPVIHFEYYLFIALINFGFWIMKQLKNFCFLIMQVKIKYNGFEFNQSDGNIK